MSIRIIGSDLLHNREFARQFYSSSAPTESPGMHPERDGN